MWTIIHCEPRIGDRHVILVDPTNICRTKGPLQGLVNVVLENPTPGQWSTKISRRLLRFKHVGSNSWWPVPETGKSTKKPFPTDEIVFYMYQWTGRWKGDSVERSLGTNRTNVRCRGMSVVPGSWVVGVLENARRILTWTRYRQKESPEERRIRRKSFEDYLTRNVLRLG